MKSLSNYLILLFLLVINQFCYAEENADTDVASTSATEASSDEQAPDLKTKISTAIENFASDHKIQAVYSIAKSGEVILNGAQGYYDIEDNRRLSTSQIMPIASGTKQITAAAILLLQDKGKLNVTDTVAKHLPLESGVWYNNRLPEWAHKVTIHHLLTHSSGVPEYLFHFKVNQNRSFNEIVRDVVNFVADEKLEYEPGSKSTYSNTGFVLLGLIIEKASKQPLGQFFTKSIFEPLNMKNTKLVPFEEGIKIQKGELNSKYPVRYFAVLAEAENHPNSDGDLKLVPVKQDVFYAPYADGGVISSTHDLIKWQNALHNGKILSKKSYDQMTKPYFKVLASTGRMETQMGYGTYISKLQNGKIYYHHEGRALGIRSDNGYIAGDDIAISMLSNVMMFVNNKDKKNVDFQKPENQVDLSYFRDAVVEEL